MSEDATADTQVTFKVKTSADGNHTITMSESATVLDLKTKLSGDEYEKVPTERMRLIYSGRVMKDPDTLATYKIKTGNTVHMVKSAASNAPKPSAATSSTGGMSSAASGVPTNMAAGTANNPLAGLTGARYAGHMGLPSADMFGPDGGLGPPPSEDDMARMLDDPNMQQMMNEALNNPQMVDMMLRSMGAQDNPQMRQMFQNPEFRRMLTNPEAMRQAAAFRRMMGGGSGGAGGGFPAPGITDSTPAGATGGNAARAPDLNNLFGPGGFQMPPGFAPGAGAANPFAALFPPGAAAAGQTPAQTPPAAASTGAGSPVAGNPPNPFASLFGGGAGGLQLPPGVTAEQMQESLRLLQNGGLFGGGGGNPFGGVGANPFGTTSPPPPADTRPPEEIYAEQLRQLNDMGFFDFDQNVAALRRSGGSVQGAIEQLLR